MQFGMIKLTLEKRNGYAHNTYKCINEMKFKCFLNIKAYMRDNFN